MGIVAAKCRECGQEYADDQDLLRCSLDAYSGPDDYDLFCPACESDDIILYNTEKEKD